MAIKGSLQVSIPIVKAILSRNFVPSKIGPKFLFRRKMGSKYNFFRDPQKAHLYAKGSHLTY